MGEPPTGCHTPLRSRPLDSIHAYTYVTRVLHRSFIKFYSPDSHTFIPPLMLAGSSLATTVYHYVRDLPEGTFK